MAELEALEAALAARFGDLPEADLTAEERAALNAAAGPLTKMAGRASHRAFDDRPISLDLLRTLCAVALSAPSKSDMQQRDIVIVSDADLRGRLLAIVEDQAWTHSVAHLLVFCGNNRRQRQIHDQRGHAFANDHLDALFNPAVDAGIALQAFITAAEAIGLGCCPISGLRNDAQAVSDALGLPDHVFPVAGLAVGWPTRDGYISPRLNLDTAVHVDRFRDADPERDIAAYDARRHAIKPMRTQRDPARFGDLPAERYTWSEDKARQYAVPERADFGQFMRGKGFDLT
jgi:nitroreductase